MEYSAIPLAHTAVSLCKTHGVRQVVISPGSRNAPLTLGFTSDPFFECFSIVDERSAAFFAMGLAQQSGTPAALVCTSGSALLNYYPAIAEAYYSRIPLLVLSADRPPYKIDIGDGQTIRQDGVYDRHIGYSARLLQDPGHATERIRWPNGDQPESPSALETLIAERQQFNEREIQKALQTAFQELLPVHLNLPFEEPLYTTTDIPPCHPGVMPFPSVGESSLPFAALRESWKQYERKMVLVGAMAPGSIPEEVLQMLAADPAVVVFTETTSNLHHPAFFPSIDSIMAPLELQESPAEGFAQLRPDLLVTLGGMIVSKKIKQFLRKYPPGRHWHVDPLSANDTFYCLDRHLKMAPGAFFSKLLEPGGAGAASGYRPYWEGVREQYLRGREAYLKRIPFSDFQAFGMLFPALPDHITLQLANSSTVRYAQLFDTKPGQRVFCNRGTSGIEGSTSTAVGASHNVAGPTVLLSGDLSFLYDANALWNAYLREDFRIIVIHNSGGGIFRILPGFRENPDFATFFETVHHRSLGPLCNMHGLKYHKAEDAEELTKQLETFFEPSGAPALLEIKTPRERNDKILLDYFQFLS